MTFIKKYSFHGLILAVFLIIYVLLNDSNTGFFSDDFVWLNRYNFKGFNGLLYNYNDQFFLPLTYLIQLVEWRIFEENYLLYFAVNSLVFISSVFVFYVLLNQVQIQFELPKYWPKLIVLILLLSPYNTEVLKWYSSQSYLFSTLFLLVAFWFYFKYRKSNQLKYLPLLSISFLISILFKEISLFFPFSILMIEYIFFQKKSKIQLFIALSIIVILYFGLRFFFLGEFIGGYGTEIHLNFSLDKIFLVIAAYFAKFFFLYRFDYGFYSMILLNSMFLFFLIKKRDQKTTLLIGSFTLLFLLSLIPVVNLEISFLDSIQSDRYGFLPGFFAATVIGTLFSLVTDKKITIVLSLVFCIIQLFFLDQTLGSWTKAKEFKNNFVQIVLEKSKDNPSFVLLNLPDNFQGVYIFRNGFEQFQNKYFPNTKIEVGVLHQFQENDKFKYELKNNILRVKTSSGKFFPYVRSNYYPISCQSKEVRFSIKNDQNPIYLFNNQNLIEVFRPN